MFSRFKTKKIVLRDEQTMELEVFEAWDVRWASRNGNYSHDTRPEVRSFPSEDEAIAFKESLYAAFKLLKYTGEITQVQIMKQED